MKMKAGDVFPDIKCCTLGGMASIKELAGDDRLILIFLRFYGCRICQMSLRFLNEAYEQFCQAGGRIAAIIQSDAETIRKGCEAYPIRFPLICDPECGLYKKFEIPLAKDREQLLGGRTQQVLKQAAELGLEPGKPEGEPMQLPAAICIGPDMMVLNVYYGTDAADIPEPEELVKWLIQK